MAKKQVYNPLLKQGFQYMSGDEKKEILFTKLGINGEVVPTPFMWYEDLKVKQVILMSNAADISVTIGANTYNSNSLIGAALPANSEMTDFDITITAGSNQGNAIIIFERV